MKRFFTNNLAFIISGFFLGLLLRLQGLGQSLWLDEGIQALAVKNNDLVSLVTKYALGDFHPPLYHVVLKFWTDLFGYSEIAVRFPSVIFSVLTGVIIYLIGKKAFGEKIGLIAMFFWQINPLAIYYGQENRVYSMAAFLVACTVFFWLTKRWFLFGVALVFVLYTDYLPYLIIPTLFIFTKDKRKFIFACCFAFLFLLPWLPFFFTQLQIGTGVAANAPGWGQVVGAFSVKSLPLTLVKFIVGRITIENKLLYSLVFGSISVAFLAILGRVKNSWWLWGWLLGPLMVGLMISLKISVFSYFRFLFVLPAFCFILAVGAKNKYVVGFISLIFLTSAMYFKVNPVLQRENWRDAVKYMESEGKLVLMPSVAQDAPIQYYKKGLVVQDKDSANVSGYKVVFLIRYVQEIFDQTDSLRNKLDDLGYRKTAEKNFNSVIVWKYENRN